MKQAGLSDDWSDDGDADDARPDAEAVAIAGNGGGHVSEVVDAEGVRFPDADGTVELMVTQVNYTIEGNGSREYPVVHVFGRTADNDPEHVRVLGFEPYFYAPTESLDDEALDRDVITRTEAGFESIRGDDLTKICTRTPRDVGAIRDDFDHYEADILFPNRLLIDKDIKSGIRVPARRLGDGTIQLPHDEIDPVDVEADLRVNTFDIEVDDRSGFPEEGEEPIVCLTSHDSYRDEYIAWLYDAPGAAEGVETPSELPGYEPFREDTVVDVRTFEREEAMLDAFVSYIEETGADIMTGWNFEDFDMPYLLDRMEVLDPAADQDLDPDRLSRIDEVWRSGWGGPDVKGRVVFDLLYAYKRTQFTELESYRLDAVGELELDAGKERYTGDIGDLWEEDPERLLEYNVRDVELCVEIDRKQDIIAFWDEVRTFVGCKLEDAPTPGDTVDQYILHEAHGRFALPSKGQADAEDYEGGAVFDPISGVKENVTVLDLKSLYPMAMTTINASPETKVDPETHDGETFEAPNGTHFRRNPDGIIREMIDTLLSEREEKKSLRNDHGPDTQPYEQYDRQQQAVKVIMNCFTPDTEVLTPTGVRNICNLDVGDAVYSIDPETMRMEVKPVEETHAYPDYRGDLVDIQTSKVDFSVTPNHRMLVRKNAKNGATWDGYRFVEAGDLDDYSHYELPHDWSVEHEDSLGNTMDIVELAREHTDATLTLSDGGTKAAARYGQANIEHTVDTDTFLEFLAWYVAEGSVYRAKTANCRVKIAQEGDTARKRITSVVDKMVDYWYEDDRGVSFSSRIWADLLDALCGHGSENMRIPEIVFNASEEQKRRFLNTVIDGDGDRKVNSWRYSTSSERLRDDVLRLCAHLGKPVNYNYDSGAWRIYCTEDAKNSIRMHRSGSRSTAEDGVYCVTVADNNTLLAGRNGKFQWAGNSLYGVLGWDRFRLYDKEMGAAVTATGREVIEHTADAAAEIGKEVIYGDSVTGDRPVVVRDPEGRMRIVPIEELFERAVDTRSAEFVTADGAPSGTAGLPKERRTANGWEALSLSDAGDAEWQPIERVIRHETDSNVVKLQHKVGESTTTRGHSYVVEDGSEFVEATPEAVDEPLRIPDVPSVEPVETIDVYEMLHGCEREYEDGRGTGGTTVKTKRVHANDEYVWFGHERYGDLDSTVKIQRSIDVDSEAGRALIRLLGAYVPEGSASTIETTSSRFGASIAESRRGWLEQLQADYHRLFENTTASIVASDTRERRTVEHTTADGGGSVEYADETLTLRMMNELAAVFFRQFAGQTSRGKRIPSFVYHLPEAQQQLFLDTLVEGDRSREFPRYADECAERNFDFETVSRELAAGLSMLLTQRDTQHSLKYREERGAYTIRTVDSYGRGRDPILTEVDHDGYVYDLSVAENENFVDGVGGVVLHNTDSVMLELEDDVSKEDAIEQSFELEEYINDSYDEFALRELDAAHHRFQIEFEKLYRRFFQAGKKKRYAGHIVWKEGKDVDDIDITGFEYKRSDIAPITKEVQKRVIEMIVRGEDTDEIVDYLNGIIEDFETGEVPVGEIGIPGGIGKRLEAYDTDTAQVRGAKYANEFLGTNFGRGSKPKRLYLRKVHPSWFREMEAQGYDPQRDPLYSEFKRDPDVICIEYDDQLPEAFKVDWDKMLNKTLKGPIERIIEALGMSWDEVKSGQEQTGLGSFT